MGLARKERKAVTNELVGRYQKAARQKRGRLLRPVHVRAWDKGR